MKTLAAAFILIFTAARPVCAGDNALEGKWISTDDYTEVSVYTFSSGGEFKFTYYRYGPAEMSREGRYEFDGEELTLRVEKLRVSAIMNGPSAPPKVEEEAVDETYSRRAELSEDRLILTAGGSREIFIPIENYYKLKIIKYLCRGEFRYAKLYLDNSRAAAY
ncbi:MAG: hypothetical protein LBU36_08525 [Clostridiales bacterium]|jgi:hypothetical protein|nr:hypothetical protein [Clostridiales bacterium]